ncbi:helix-turn-helix transcriptional regulator [Streptomyces luteireticuli]|uniref:XRE family transcriptional regulator n=1 Tax=Streptomyces luteireticuli TaxID=173858 RepID=A0ABN0YVJ5_9ACTN
MGRVNSALDQPDPVATLAQWLRSLRRRSGKSWSQVARTAEELGLPVSRSTLDRAAKGEVLPKWGTVRAFARACGGDEREAKRLWTRADRSVAAGPGARVQGVLPPQFVSEPWELFQAMAHLRREHGNPTLRELEERAYVDAGHKVSLLPRSTLGPALRGTRFPRKDLLLSFVRHCGGVPERGLRDWADAWERADAFRRGRARPPDEVARLRDELARTREQLDRARLALAEARAAS